jgi:predicted molibdopterin-dependent oxidoreductase YjgC
MFKRLPDIAGATVAITIDGTPFSARAGDSVAAALLLAGRAACGTTAVTGQKRAPYCLMGVCFECLVTIDGEAARQACLVSVRDGMRIETQPATAESAA